MAGKSNTELIQNLQLDVANLKTEIAVVSHSVETADLQVMRDRLKELEVKVDELRRLNDKLIDGCFSSICYFSAGLSHSPYNSRFCF